MAMLDSAIGIIYSLIVLTTLNYIYYSECRASLLQDYCQFKTLR